MPKAVLNGATIAYEIIGDGAKNAIITPGGRYSKDTPGIREFAEAMARLDYRTVIWDRPNSGELDVCFDYDTESFLNADMLAALLRHLDMTPALVFGGSAGGRVSMLAEVRHPGTARKLVFNWLTGGSTGLAILVGVYCGGLERAAKTGGMQAVVEHADLAEPIARNPANREKLIAYDPEEFCAILQRWGWSFFPKGGSPIPDMAIEDFAKIDVPTMIFRSGRSDYSHPRFISDQVHSLIPESRLVDPPWADREWIEIGSRCRGISSRAGTCWCRRSLSSTGKPSAPDSRRLLGQVERSGRRPIRQAIGARLSSRSMTMSAGSSSIIQRVRRS